MISKYSKFEKRKIVQYILCFVVFLKVDYFIYLNSAINTIYSVLEILVSLGFIIKLLINKSAENKVKINYFFFFLILYNFLVIPFSVTQGVTSLYDVFEVYGSAIYRISFCAIIAIGLKRNAKILITSLTIVITSYVLINILSVIIFPNGIWTTGLGNTLTEYWFLGYDNAHIVMYIYSLLMLGLLNYLNGNSIRSKSLILIYLLCVFVTIKLWSATALVALLLLGLYIFFPIIFDKMSSLFNIRTYVIVVTFVCIFIIAFAINSKNGTGGIMSFILTTLLNKDVGFNSRYYIWSNYLSNIGKHFLFGNGIESSQILILKNGVNGAHNEWLQILYNGGICHFIFYLLFLYYSCKKLWKYRNKGCARLVSISIFGMMIVQMMRGCPEIYWMSMLTIGYYIEELVRAVPKNVKTMSQ